MAEVVNLTNMLAAGEAWLAKHPDAKLSFANPWGDNEDSRKLARKLAAEYDPRLVEGWGVLRWLEATHADRKRGCHGE